MRISILFGQRKETYDGEYAPEVLLAWDEHAQEDNREGWLEALAREQKFNGPQMQAMRVIDIEVDQDKIRQMLIGVPHVRGMIKEQ